MLTFRARLRGLPLLKLQKWDSALSFPMGKGRPCSLGLILMIFLDKLCPHPVSSRLLFQHFPPSSTKSPRHYSWLSPVKTAVFGLEWNPGIQHWSRAQLHLFFHISLPWVHYFIVRWERCEGWGAHCSLPIDSLPRATTDIYATSCLWSWAKQATLDPPPSQCFHQASPFLQIPASKWGQFWGKRMCPHHLQSYAQPLDIPVRQCHLQMCWVTCTLPQGGHVCKEYQDTNILSIDYSLCTILAFQYDLLILSLGLLERT